MIKSILKTLGRVVMACVVLIVLLLTFTLALWLIKEPSNDRQWEFGQQRLQFVQTPGSSVNITNLRDFDWKADQGAGGTVENYRTISFDISDVTGLEVGVSHFSPRAEIAHVFVVFNLIGGDDVALSIEARRDGGEEFSLSSAMLLGHELQYILASKQDLLTLREIRSEPVYLYPMDPTVVTPAKAQELFSLVAMRVNTLHNHPEFYHPVFKNCTNQITKLVESISTKRFPFYAKTFAPGFTGEVLFDMDLIDLTGISDDNSTENSTNFLQIKENFRVQF